MTAPTDLPATSQSGAQTAPPTSAPARSTSHDQPARRPIRIYSFDPMLANTLDRIGPGVVTVGIPWEPLKPGPAGVRVQVIDFDGSRMEGQKNAAAFYRPIDLNDPDIAVQAGLAPTERDPRFHQQMVYAVAMRTLEAYDKALGRLVRPVGGRLRLFPHAFRGDNAFYDPQLRAVLFGYFAAGRDSPGANLPGQTVFTSLSHDIISHEVTHGLIHRIRPQLLDGTNPDVGAFHEAIADITAVMLHFTLPGVVEQTLGSSRTRLTSSLPLLQLAQQFGYATGRGSALRGAGEPPDPERLATTLEPHERGSFLVSAVLDAFTTSYQRRIADLLRIATGGTGVLPRGSLHPDLIARVSREAVRSADQVLTVCLRALDYLPPVDVTYSDFLRAIVTADRELFPTDAGGLRTAFVDGFRRRGIYPEGVMSLAEDALSWVPFEASGPEEGILPMDLRSRILALDTLLLDPRQAWEVDYDSAGLDPWTAADGQAGSRVASKAGTRATRAPSQVDRHPILRQIEARIPRDYRAALELHPDRDVKVRDFQTTIRYDEDGAPHVQFVVQCDQQVLASEFPDLNAHLVESTIRRATTLIFDEAGRIRFSIAKPLPGPNLPAVAVARAQKRAEDLRAWLDESRSREPGAAFGFGASPSNMLRIDFALMHGGLR